MFNKQELQLIFDALEYKLSTLNELIEFKKQKKFLLESEIYQLKILEDKFDKLNNLYNKVDEIKQRSD